MNSTHQIYMTAMKVQNPLQLIRLDLDEACEMIAEGASLAQIGAKFDRSRNVIRMAGRVEAKSMIEISD